MSGEPAQPPDLSHLKAELEERAQRERASGGYRDDLSGFQLETPGAAASDSLVDGFDLRSGSPRVRFRPELGFSTKPLIGPAITLVKRFYLRLLLYVFDDLARQTDTAIGRVETALAVEIAARERLEREVEKLGARIAQLERSDGDAPG